MTQTGEASVKAHTNRHIKRVLTVVR